jgi:hypothetical protein
MSRLQRICLAGIGIAVLALAAGFLMQAPWATGLWPVEAGRLSNIFVASIFAAIGGPACWIAVTGDSRAVVPGAADLAVTNTGFAASGFWFWQTTGNPAMLPWAIGTALMAAICIVLVWRLQPVPFRDATPMPRPLRIAFMAFAIMLAIAAFRLITVWPNTFPWPLSPENSVFYGFIFLGAMVYFLYGFFWPVWGNAGGQMVGFLLYDLVLLPPFIGHFSSVKPEMLLSLTIYTIVVTLSGLIAIWYLFIDPATRFGARRHPAAAA